MRRSSARVPVAVSIVLGCVAVAALPAAAPEPSPFASVRLGAEAKLEVAPGRLIQSLGQPAIETWKPKTNEEKARGVEDVYTRVAPATVVVKNRGSHGTGWVIDPEGWVLTNHHVIADADLDPDTRVRIATVYVGRLDGDFMRLSDDGIPAAVYKVSEEKDLALLKLSRLPKGAKSLPAVALAKDGPRPGSDCVAVGHPAAGMLWTLRTGVVSGIAQWPEDMLDVVMKRLSLKEVDRPRLKDALSAAPRVKVLISNCGINPGDSGGPLVNTKGELIAVTFAVPRTLGGVSLDKLAYHVHVDEVKTFIQDRPKTPPAVDPDPWPVGHIVDRVDLDKDGVPETLAFGVERGGPPTGMLLDLDQDSARKFTADQLASPARFRAWDFEFASHLVSDVLWTFYDTDNDGKIDLVLIDKDKDGIADQALRLDKTWQKVTLKSQQLVDPSLFKNDAVRERFINILKGLAKK